MPNAIKKSNEEIAMHMMLRPARTEAGRKVQQVVLFRVELTMWIEEALKGA